MRVLRAIARQNAILWTVLLVTAVAIKATVPTGYMVSTSSEKLIEISICHGTTGERGTALISIPMKADTSGEKQTPAKGDAQCAFSALAQQAVGGAAAELLAIALAAILVLGLAPLGKLDTASGKFLRPPLRGPPLAI